MAGRDSGASPATAVDPLIGEVLASRYQIEHRLGEGAMGTVYRARHVKVGRPFAVKVLHQRLLADGKISERFEREAELAGRLRHPNLIGVVDVGETHGRRYMVMDFAEGLDLAALLNEAPMPAPRVIRLTRQLLEGLYHAHEAGLIHRDFKPENVIVERDDHGEEVPRIVDFGIAILREAGDSAAAPGRLTTNGLVLGTPHYMAPEQAVADPIDHRIDLFALGIIIYEMLSGKLPFDGSGAEVARANLLLDPPPIAKRVPFLEVDPLLEAFARRLMAKRRDQRPATAKAARELLDLITLDPAAAARALDLDPSVSRAPNVTAPVATMAVPERPTDEPRPALVTPPQAPPMPVPVAIAEPMRAPSEPTPETPAPAPRGLQTQVTTPLTWDGDDDLLPPKRSRGALLAAVGVAAALGIGVALIVSHGHAKASPPVDPIAMELTPTPVPAPSPAPIAEPPAPTPADPPAPTPTPAHVMPTPPPRPTPPVHVAANVPSPRPVTPTPTQPAATTDSSSSAIAAQYEQLGAELTALQNAKGEGPTRALWVRYRRVQLGTAMNQPAAQRAETAALLAKLHADVRAAAK